MKNNKMKNQNGFTVIELIVALAIAAAFVVLVSMLLG